MIIRDDIQSSALARLFSATVMKELSGRGTSPTFARLIKESGLKIDSSSRAFVSTLFDAAFEILKLTPHRHEYIYKAALTQKVLLGIHSLSTASMITEFRVGPCKADVVILNGTGTVYEIKSERDSLSRLSRQVEAYSNVFAKVNVILGKNHVDAALASVPEHVGIMILSDRYQVSQIRDAVEDASRTSPNAIFDAINQREAILILKNAGVDIPDVPNTKRYSVLRDLFSELEPAFAHSEMVTVLKRTRDLRPLQNLLDEIPTSLYSASISARLRSKEQLRLVQALRTPIYQAVAW